MKIKIENLVKKYGSKKVLNDISISFESGKIQGIIGENGAGKSTFFECLCGFKKYEGKIDCDFRNIAYLPTSPLFYPKLTGNEYLAFIYKITNTQKKKALEELFKLPLNKYVENYSTGMKKKLSFLGLLLLDKTIYILDEPFNGVDLGGVELFSSIIKKLKNQGKTILISSHIIDSLTTISDDIYLLDKGVFSKKYSKDNFISLKTKISSSFDKKVADVFK